MIGLPKFRNEFKQQTSSSVPLTGEVVFDLRFAASIRCEGAAAVLDFLA